MHSSIESTKTNKTTLSILFCIVFFDLVGIGIILPILPLVFLDSNVFPEGTALAAKTFLLGLLIAAYPLAQFFGAPLLGTLSDKYGRKNILIISLIGTIIGYSLFAFGLTISNIFLLFVGRLIDGFTGGNISVARSAIADISGEKDKAKNFGLMGMAFGLGFIFGPYLGGKLTDSTILPWFNATTPFWTAAVLVTLNLLFVILAFNETLKQRMKPKITLFTGVEHMKKAFTHPQLKVLFYSIFLVHFGWSFFAQFFPVFLEESFNITPSHIGTIFAYMGLCVALAQGVVIRPLAQRYPEKTLLSISILATALAILLYLIIPETWMIYLIMPLVAVSFGFNLPLFSTLLSNSASAAEQGEILGIQQSMMSLAQSIPPLIGGIAIALNVAFPTLLASATIFIAWILFTFGYCKGRS